MRKGIAVFGATMLLVAGVALATGPTFRISVNPNTPGAESTFSVSASGPFGQSGLPTSMKLIEQKGFQSSAKSVAVLCPLPVSPTSTTPCPSGSKVGSGQAVVKVQGVGQLTSPLTLYLAKPHHRGDIASIVLSANTVAGTQNVVGRLFRTGSGGIETLFTHLITSPLTATLNKISFSTHAVRGTHSFTTNPPSCSGGHWSATLRLGFTSGADSKKVSIGCTK
jgi:hypothetical protein